jgi:IS1 family transposase
MVLRQPENIVFGNKKDILKMLEIEENGYIGTSYVERFNLTIRDSLARFIRKGMNFSKK